jgi:hypothetical protein
MKFTAAADAGAWRLIASMTQRCGHTTDVDFDDLAADGIMGTFSAQSKRTPLLGGGGWGPARPAAGETASSGNGAKRRGDGPT